MKIVGGEARGRRIDAPVGRDTRPTGEKVREAVFSMLGGSMNGDDVLDVFGGSGALGLESISRGASSAVIIDSSRKAASVIARNIAALGYSDRATVICRPWRAAFGEIAGRKFSVVFLDPPYKNVDEYSAVSEALISGDMLRNGAVLVMEYARGVQLSGLPQALMPLKPHNYGDTCVTLYRYVLKPDGAADRDANRDANGNADVESDRLTEDNNIIQ